MIPLTITSHVDADGVLRVALPLGPAKANRDVEITIKDLPRIKMTQAEHEAFIRSIAGSWEGEFERIDLPPQERDEL